VRAYIAGAVITRSFGGKVRLIADAGQIDNLFGFSLIQQDDGSQTRTLLADGLGSVRVEMVGSAVDSATTYEPYGKLLARSGHSGTVYGFTGEQHDAATGLVYLRARYYNPNLKVFMSRDPFPGWQTVPASQHGYSYVHNNPVNLTDPSGEFVPLLPLIVGGFVIGVVTGVTWDVMVNQGKGGLDNLHNILNPHYYCDVNWGQTAFTGAGGGLIGVVAAPAMGMASAAATGAYNAVPGAYAHWLHYSAYKYPWLGKFATTATTAVGLADTVSDNILRVRALLGDPYAQSVMAEAMVTWNPGLAFRGLSDNDRVDYFRRQLANPGDYVEAPSGTMSFNTLVGLARENVEFGLYRLADGRRILVRGTEHTVSQPPGLPVRRVIAHTHFRTVRPSTTDIEGIWITQQLPQTHSYIVTANGAVIKFSPNDLDPELFNYLLKKHRGVD
jgi:RHS repeat-associated protein